MKAALRPLRPLRPLLVLLVAVLAALALRAWAQAPPPGYAEGYAFGRDEGPAGHLSGAEPTDRLSARSECGEHALTDGVETNDAWMDGCVDGALRLPKSPPES